MSKPSPTQRSAIEAINQSGALLVFPLDNRPKPASLWSHFHPRTPMRWEWDEGGDDRVANLWHLRGELSTTRKVVYSKWFRGRATYFSRAVFPALLRTLNPELTRTSPNHQTTQPQSLSPTARSLLNLLEADSPLSTKQLKALADLKGKANERHYDRALRELWSRFLIVAFGEVDDGAFPSLAIGSTQVLFEDLWQEGLSLSMGQAKAILEKQFSADNLFYQNLKKLEGNSPAQKSLGKTRTVPKIVRFDKLL